MSTLLLDLGNTRLKIAVATPAPDPVALAHADAGFDAALRQALLQHSGADQALLASVVPPALEARVTAALRAQGMRVERVAVDPARPDLRVCYQQPERFGVDRWLALIGARRHSGVDEALLVAACGTAITVDLVEADGTHLGGAIAPAPALMAEALRGRATHLPADAQGAGGAAFACDTGAAIAAGCAAAAAGMLARCAVQAALRTARAPRLLLTGGGAPALLPLIDALQPSYHPWLVLDGLAAIAAERDSLR